MCMALCNSAATTSLLITSVHWCVDTHMHTHRNTRSPCRRKRVHRWAELLSTSVLAFYLLISSWCFNDVYALLCSWFGDLSACVLRTSYYNNNNSVCLSGWFPFFFGGRGPIHMPGSLYLWACSRVSFKPVANVSSTEPHAWVSEAVWFHL